MKKDVMKLSGKYLAMLVNALSRIDLTGVE
jgi:hypothetical protein